MNGRQSFLGFLVLNQDSSTRLQLPEDGKIIKWKFPDFFFDKPVWQSNAAVEKEI